jgi:CDP-diacylglycerol--glycerol-3-phosphate 3-phosphatidyltransferase
MKISEMNLPNKLTLLRILLIPLFILCFYISSPFINFIGIIIFCVASFTDFLDGYIARKHNLVTDFGKFMDPLADKILTLSAWILLVEHGKLAAWIVIIILTREFAITGFRQLAQQKQIVLAANQWGKIKTVTQLITIILFLISFIFGVSQVLLNIMTVLVLIITLYSGYTYFVDNKKVFSK